MIDPHIVHRKYGIVKTVHEDGHVSYTSGRISTQWKHDFTYGLFEARLRVPKDASKILFR